MPLGLPARAQRALETTGLQHWMIYDAENIVGRRAVRVAYEKLTGDVVRFEFEIAPGVVDFEEWIEAELIQRLSRLHDSQ